MTTPTLIRLCWADVEAAAEVLADRWASARHMGVYGIPRGGSVAAALVARSLDVGLADQPGPGVLVVDDLVDSGRTLGRYDGHDRDALYRKPHSPRELAPQALELDGWLLFPWENDEGNPVDAVTRLLEFIGEDPRRDGLLDTPRRVTAALQEMTSGYGVDPIALLGATFDVAYDQMVVVTGIDFVSLCEHHMLPFTGRASVAYIPSERVVGLSKLARVVEVFARRLQIQERLTQQIAEAIHTALDPVGVGVVIRARHTCMACRGIRKDADMVTSALLGALREKAEARAEFLALARQG